jgi:hypothetical protein
MTMAGAQSEEIVGGILSLLTKRPTLDETERDFLAPDLFTSPDFRIKSKQQFQ